MSKKYDTPAVVFDRYEELTTKNLTPQRRSKVKVSATVNFIPEMTCVMTKSAFLYNAKIKNYFMEMLHTFQEKVNCQTC